jgi:hypothetical protein
LTSENNHDDHPFALLKYSVGQLSTLVNFESADAGLDDQFLAGANTTAMLAEITFLTFIRRPSSVKNATERSILHILIEDPM